MSAFLGVECSATGRRWTGPGAAEDRLSQTLVQETGFGDALCRVLGRLGVAPDEAEAYLTPSLRDLMPDPSSLRDMDRAAERLAAALSRRERIAVFADYDADGATSATLLVDWLRQLGHGATLYVPDRIKEGFGPNASAMKGLAKAHDVIICVDCGTVAHEAIAAAEGVDVLVLDHHLGDETLPPALAVVNPNRRDESGALQYLCAAGVVFLLLVATNRLLRAEGRTGPDLLGMLDLVALGTIADVAPLVGLNRALVRQGLRVMAARNRPGLTALCDIARLDAAPNAYHLGFLLGPRVNAGGRLGRSDLGARLLMSTDVDEAAALAEKLDQLNTERRQIEERITGEALAQAETRGFDNPLVWAAGAGWHPGVVGIVASRLREAANRPAVVIGFDDKTGIGSGRSVLGVDLGQAVTRIAAENLLTKGGGHKMAAGMSLREDQLEPAMARLGALLEKAGAGKIGPAEIRLDGVLEPTAVTADMIAEIDRAGPFGAGADAPRFALPAMRVSFAKRAGDSHLRLTLQGRSGARIDAIAFGAFKGPLGPLLYDHGGAAFHVAGQLDIDTWGGRRKPKLRLEDACRA